MAKKRKTLAQLKRKLQPIFNAYIRKRDEGLPCISCNKKLPGTTMQAGHFFSVRTYDGLRFDEDNVHGECFYDNMFNDSHLIYYRENLLEKIGQVRFRALYKRAEDYKRNGYKWSRSELEDMIIEYRQKLKEL